MGPKAHGCGNGNSSTRLLMETNAPVPAPQGSFTLLFVKVTLSNNILWFHSLRDPISRPACGKIDGLGGEDGVLTICHPGSRVTFASEMRSERRAPATARHRLPWHDSRHRRESGGDLQPPPRNCILPSRKTDGLVLLMDGSPGQSFS